jgi:glycerol-3-phosphate dehydrogenase
MGKIIRDPESASKRSYDLIIIGGGIYGVMLAYEASKRRLKTLLLEKNDFGGATSFNCLRILHGGFRYLQTMDFYRFRESVIERKWFLKNFPGLVKPLPCLMPLYGDRLRHPSVLRIAACINDILSCKRNNGIVEDNQLPRSKVIGPEKTKQVFPDVNDRGLKGAVVWYDAFMPDSQLILMEILKKSCEHDCTALNYVEAQGIINGDNNIAGVTALDTENGQTYEYRSRIIINAAGPWCRKLAADFDRDIPELFIGSLSWNVLLDRDALSTHALAVASKKRQARTYFLLPWKNKILVGTGHAPWYGDPETPRPSLAMIKDFLNDLNLAIPTFKVGVEDILHVFSGLLPASKAGTVDLTDREVIYDHSKNDGPVGLYSVSGIKFTTARRVAEKTLFQIYPETKPGFEWKSENFDHTQNGWNNGRILDYYWRSELDDETWRNAISEIIQNEAVVHLDDLLFRRSTLWEDRQLSLALSKNYASLFFWDEVRHVSETERLKRILERTEPVC